MKKNALARRFFSYSAHLPACPTICFNHLKFFKNVGLRLRQNSEAKGEIFMPKKIPIWKTIRYKTQDGTEKELDLILMFLDDDDNIEDGYTEAKKLDLRHCPDEDIHQINFQIKELLKDSGDPCLRFLPVVISTTKDNCCYIAGDEWADKCFDLTEIRPTILLGASHMIFYLPPDKYEDD